MSFADIKGQDSAISFLQSAIANGKVSHAYIFVGPSGVGKRLTALNFAKALNCLEAEEKRPCGLCSQCKKIDASNHPDVFIFSPAKAESSLGIDRIRALSKDIALKPYEARKKVYILERADSMTQEAQNALLKTLEEPPSGSVLILILENMNAVFSTIQSRSERIQFFSLPAADLEQILVGNYKIEKRKAKVLARLSSGQVAKALKYNEEGFFTMRERLINALEKGDLADSDFDGLSKVELEMVLESMLTWYRDILVTKAGAEAKTQLVNIDKLELIKRESERLGFDMLDDMINQVMLTGSLLEQNVNAKLAMGVLCMKSFR